MLYVSFSNRWEEVNLSWLQFRVYHSRFQVSSFNPIAIGKFVRQLESSTVLVLVLVLTILLYSHAWHDMTDVCTVRRTLTAQNHTMLPVAKLIIPKNDLGVLIVTNTICWKSVTLYAVHSKIDSYILNQWQKKVMRSAASGQTLIKNEARSSCQGMR
jgi:hypothetical protein